MIIKFVDLVTKKWKIYLLLFLVINLVLRLLIYHYTVLFNLSDYSIQWNGLKEIEEKGAIPLIRGNFQMTIAYLGYFLKSITGSIDSFFLLNSILGTLTSLILFVLVVKVFKSRSAGLLTVLLHTLYTEFIVFSSVFYSPIIMIFLLSLVLLLLYYYYTATQKIISILLSVFLIIIICISYVFKPELIFFSFFLLVLSGFFVNKDHVFFRKTIQLSLFVMFGTFLFLKTGIISDPQKQAISNDFIFFGHTDYGGDGGEGSFVYPTNRARFQLAYTKYRNEKGIVIPTSEDKNRFQISEIKKYIFGSPLKWIGIQLKKFFREYGVVPETTSFKILYTGIFQGRLWATAFIVVLPVMFFVFTFIMFFDFREMKKMLVIDKTSPDDESKNAGIRHFFYVYLLLFFYYIIATVFFGHYQERYRLPVIVLFLIPILSYFISMFDKKRFYKRISVAIKGTIIILFLVIWVFQAKNALKNNARFQNAIESTKIQIEKSADS
jgi:4-amino-4-deoxy-L-arabinose transferase-like glycosyltransferase